MQTTNKIEKKFNFVYITTNIINGKQYVGEHSTDDLNSQKTKYYLGSGKLTILPAIKLYGRKNFKREILEFFPTKQEAFDAQSKYIIMYNTLAPNGYNISPKGGNGCSKPCKEETKIKLRKPLSLEARLKISKGNTGKKHTLEQNKNHSIAITGENNPMFGISLKDKWIEKLGEIEGIKRYNLWLEKQRICRIGVDTSHPTIVKRCEFCEKDFSLVNYIRWHGDKCKLNPNKVERVLPKLKICEYCKNEYDPLNYAKYHGDKCKLNPNNNENDNKILCIYCNRFFYVCTYVHYHGNKCKLKP